MTMVSALLLAVASITQASAQQVILLKLDDVVARACGEFRARL